MKEWLDTAVKLLKESLGPAKAEHNELDWKAGVSPDGKRLAEHLSAFANYPKGGFLVYGVGNSGVPSTLADQTIASALNHLANVGRQSVEPPIGLDHAIMEYDGCQLLFVHIPEGSVKPVHLRNHMEEAFIRSCGTTRKASRQEIAMLLLNSKMLRWEIMRASNLLSNSDLIHALDWRAIFTTLERPKLNESEDILMWMESEKFIEKEPSGGGYITNLGAIAAAEKIENFADISRKAVRVVVYDGFDKSKTKQEIEGKKGYAVGFQKLLAYVVSLLPQSEVIEKALRQNRCVYPEIALREIIANALIHQDFSISGTSPLIEIFDDRIEISNPGGLLPSKQVDRLIGANPESRNEQLARAFRRYRICEERGSGLIKAGLQAELYGLPPIEFIAGANYFKAILRSPKTFVQMSENERLQACFQHASLRYYSDSSMTNKSLRERLKMPEKQRSMVSLVIQEALDRGLIKRADPENKSKKFAEYLPYFA